MAKTKKISKKEMNKLQTQINRLNEIRQLNTREQSALNDLLDLIGDRYGVNLLDGSYKLTENGEIVENKSDESTE